MLRALLIVLLASLDLPAQVVQLSGACPPTGTYSMTSGNAPVAGTTLQLDTQFDEYHTGWPVPFVGLGVLLLGASDPGLIIPGCGCGLHASMDVLLAQAMPTSITTYGGCTWQCFWSGHALATFHISLPPGTAGFTFFAQSAFIKPAPAVYGTSPCNLSGDLFWLSESYQLTVQ